jgi:hypothetical protein
MLNNLKAIKPSTTNDCIILAESDLQKEWLNSPQILFLLYPICQKLFGKIDNFYILSHPIYEMAIHSKIEILSLAFY